MSGLVIDVSEISFLDAMRLVNEFRGTRFKPVMFDHQSQIDTHWMITSIDGDGNIPVIIDPTGSVGKLPNTTRDLFFSPEEGVVVMKGMFEFPILKITNQNLKNAFSEIQELAGVIAIG
jgi:hypothetical protein